MLQLPESRLNVKGLDGQWTHENAACEIGMQFATPDALPQHDQPGWAPANVSFLKVTFSSVKGMMKIHKDGPQPPTLEATFPGG